MCTSKFVRHFSVWRFLVGWIVLNLGLVGILAPQFMTPLPVSAASHACTEAGLDEALGAGDTSATFSCAGTTTITITAPKVVTQTVSLDGGGLLTISGNSAMRIFSVNAGVQLTLQNITLTNGAVTGGNGGAIYNNGTLNVYTSTIANSVVTGSAVADTGAGGGIYNNGNATITNSSILTNIANAGTAFHSGYGGGIANSVSGNLTVTGSIFRDNRAYGLPGGGAILNFSNLTVTLSQFINNRGDQDGGAIDTEVKSGGQTFSVSTSLFASNTAGDAGGAIYNGAFNSIVTASSFDSNSSTGKGGAINLIGGSMTIRSSTFNNNVTYGPDGGGAIRTEAGANSVTVANSTFVSNSSAHYGGGIYVINGSATVINSTLTNNAAGTGFNGGNLIPVVVGAGNVANITLSNTIIASGTPDNCFVFGGGTFTSNGNNLENTNTCNLIGAGDLPNTTPLLGSLKYNGGPTMTRSNLTGSPAVDAGNNAVCAAAPVNGVDQRGVTRPVGTNCDIGAFEGLETPTAVKLSSFTATSNSPLEWISQMLDALRNAISWLIPVGD